MEILVFGKIANFAQNFLEMAKTKKKVTAKKTVKPVAKSAKKVAKPAPKKAVKPATKKKVAAKPVAKKATAKKTVKPTPKKAVKPLAKKKAVAKPAPKKVVKPVAKKKVTAKKAVKSAPKKTPKGSVVKAVKPVVKKAAKPAPKKTVKVPAKAVKPAPKRPSPGSTAKAVKPVVTKKVERTAAKPIAAPKVSAKPKVKVKKVVHEALPAKALITIQKNVVEEEKPQLISQQLRYSDEDLKEFKAIIDKKLDSARDELNYLKESLENHTDSQEGNKAWNLEEGADTSEMEYLMNQISRQNKFIRDLEMALVRIENKTYGVCRASGKLIDKNRLRIVPHATLSIEAKNSRKGGDDITPNTSATSAHMGSEGEGFGNDEN